MCDVATARWCYMGRRSNAVGQGRHVRYIVTCNIVSPYLFHPLLQAASSFVEMLVYTETFAVLYMSAMYVLFWIHEWDYAVLYASVVCLLRHCAVCVDSTMLLESWNV